MTLKKSANPTNHSLRRGSASIARESSAGREYAGHARYIHICIYIYAKREICVSRVCPCAIASLNRVARRKNVRRRQIIRPPWNDAEVTSPCVRAGSQWTKARGNTRAHACVRGAALLVAVRNGGTGHAIGRRAGRRVSRRNEFPSAGVGV